MSLLLIITIGTFLVFLIHLSVSDLRKKKMQMYKEQYEKALQSGNLAKIEQAGKEYHTFLQPKVQPTVIEAFIKTDITNNAHYQY